MKKYIPVLSYAFMLIMVIVSYETEDSFYTDLAIVFGIFCILYYLDNIFTKY